MCKGMIGKKLGMTGQFTSDGRYIPVTVVQLGPCVVTQIKTIDSDGYNALQIGFGEKKPSRINKPMQGHLAKSGGNFSALREFDVDDPDKYEVGQAIEPQIFEVGERIDVSGTTKGRGFSGTIKRYGFHRGPMTHGSHNKRMPGSIGCSAWPAKVVKGKKMPGRYGTARQTVRNLEIVDIRPDDNLILIKGAIPGHKSALVTLKKSKIAK